MIRITKLLITYERHPDANERNRFKDDVDAFCDMILEKYPWVHDVKEFRELVEKDESDTDTSR